MIFKHTVYVGPNSNTIKKKVFTDKNGKIYRYITDIKICPVSEFT